MGIIVTDNIEVHNLLKFKDFSTEPIYKVLISLSTERSSTAVVEYEFPDGSTGKEEYIFEGPITHAYSYKFRIQNVSSELEKSFSFNTWNYPDNTNIMELPDVLKVLEQFKTGTVVSVSGAFRYNDTPIWYDLDTDVCKMELYSSVLQNTKTEFVYSYNPNNTVIGTEPNIHLFCPDLDLNTAPEEVLFQLSTVDTKAIKDFELLNELQKHLLKDLVLDMNFNRE